MSADEFFIDFELIEQQTDNLRNLLAELQGEKTRLYVDPQGYSDDPELQALMDHAAAMLSGQSGSALERTQVIEGRLLWAIEQLTSLVEEFRQADDDYGRAIEGTLP